MDKITEIFESAAEGEKKSFQGCVTSLLELHVTLSTKRTAATENGKEYTCLNNHELKVIEDWILDLAGRLSGHYNVLDRMNRNAFKMHRCQEKIREMKLNTPSIKGLNERAA